MTYRTRMVMTSLGLAWDQRDLIDEADLPVAETIAMLSDGVYNLLPRDHL
jgi:hypothetical protein